MSLLDGPRLKPQSRSTFGTPEAVPYKPVLVEAQILKLDL